MSTTAVGFGGGRFAEVSMYVALGAAGAGVALGSPSMIAVGGIGVVLAALRYLPRDSVVAPAAVALLWSNAAVVLSSRVGLPTATGLLPQVLFLGVVIGRLGFRQYPMVATPAFRLLLLHGAAVAAAAMFALDHGPVMSATATLIVEGVILWFLAVNALHNRRDVERATVAVVVVCGLIGTLSIFQFATGSFDNDFLGFAQIDESRAELLDEAQATGEEVLLRLSGQIGEQNRYAQSMLVIVPLALALARVRNRLWPLVAVLPIVAAVALTGSRGAVVGLMATLIVMLAYRLVSIRAVAVVVVAGMMAISILPGYRDRVLSAFTAIGGGFEDTAEVDGSTLSRVTENLAAIDMFADHPALGVGPDGYPRLYEAYAERVGLLVKDQARQPHNLYLGIAAETGLAGLLTFVAVPAAVLLRLHRVWRRSRLSDPRLAAMSAGFISAIAAYLTTGVFLHLAFERYYWMLLALADAAASTGHASVRQRRRSTATDAEFALDGSIEPDTVGAPA